MVVVLVMRAVKGVVSIAGAGHRGGNIGGGGGGGGGGGIGCA